MSYNEIKDSLKYNKNFLTILPKNLIYKNYTLNPVRLNVIQGDGVSVTPDVKITVNDLNEGKKSFINASGEGDKFKVNVLIKKDETFKGEVYDYLWNGNIIINPNNRRKDDVPLIDALDYWIKNMTVLMVTTRAIDIPNGEYIITGNSNRKQTNDLFTIWELEFTRYTGVTMYEMVTTKTYAQQAINKYNASKKKAAAVAKAKSVKNKTFRSKCKLSVLVYSKTKKYVYCVRLMQNILKKSGFYNANIDGWYGTETVKAVKLLQKKYKSKYNLSVTGRVDQKTFNVIRDL